MTIADYQAQCDRMVKNAQDWLQRREFTEPAKIQFNFPRNVCLIAPISQALKNHFVSTNEPGLSLIRALGPWDHNEPTVLQVRVILEFLFGNRDIEDELNPDGGSGDTPSERPG